MSVSRSCSSGTEYIIIITITIRRRNIQTSRLITFFSQLPLSHWVQSMRRRYLIFTFSERHVTVCHCNVCHHNVNGRVTVCHYNDTRSTVTRWSFDNDQRHVTAFRPISEAAHSWSCDKLQWCSRDEQGVIATLYHRATCGRTSHRLAKTEDRTQFTSSREKPCSRTDGQTDRHAQRRSSQPPPRGGLTNLFVDKQRHCDNYLITKCHA